MANETITGPMVVPTLLMPPAKLKRMFPFEGSPICIARGLAAICCKENPKPTVNSPEINKGKEALFEAGIKSKVPKAEIINPKDKPFLYPITFKISLFNKEEIPKYIKDPTV